jgi:hypothetical protein
VSIPAPELAGYEVAYRKVRERAGRLALRLEALPVPRVLAAFVVAQWAVIAGVALTVRHNGWVYYQGGDQLWYYTLGWLLVHGHLGHALVGYGWSAVLAPFAGIAGPDLASALPAIVLLNVVVLMPIAMLALYGIASRLGGRVFGYWTLLLWTIVPVVGIKYADKGFHQQFTELTLPQSLGLTALADFPTLVAFVVSLYFCTRALFDARPELLDFCAAGVAAGAAVALKPSAALLLLGPALAFAYRRKYAGAGLFVAGLAPEVITLTLWKARGLGNVPLFSSAHASLAGLASAAPLGFLNLGRYTRNLSYHQLATNVDLLREHFWSGRLIVWLVLAGVIALGRHSLTALLLFAGSFLPFALIKGSYIWTSVQDASLFRVLMPCYPIFVLLLALLPLLLPHSRRLLRAWQPAYPRPRPRLRLGLVGLAVLVAAVVPLGAFAAAGLGSQGQTAVVTGTAMPVPIDSTFKVTARLVGRRKVLVSWSDRYPVGGSVFYAVSRLPNPGLTCTNGRGAPLCSIEWKGVGATRQGGQFDTPPPGRWFYRVAIVANWLNDPAYGDAYVLSRAIPVTVPR